MSVAALPRIWKKPSLIKSAWLRWTLIVGAVVYLALVFQTTPVNWTRVWEGLPRGAAFVSAFFPPDFISRWDEIAEGIAESLWMTVVSTVVGIAISIPVGIGAAKNIAPAPTYYFCRAILAVSRSFQEVILAIFFVKLFGFGPFAGFVTLSFATIGFYGKLLAEDRILHRNWDRYDTRQVVYRPRGLSSDQLIEGYRRAYRDFHRKEPAVRS